MLLEFVIALQAKRGDSITIAALDGKTLRGVWEAGDQLKALCVFSHNGLAALDQVAIGAHLEEPRAAQAWMETVAARCPGLEMLTGDALYADTTLAQAIVDRGKDYTFKLKKPAPTPRRRILALHRGAGATGLGSNWQRARTHRTPAGLGIWRTGWLRCFPRPIQCDNGQKTGQPPRSTASAQCSVRGIQPVRSGSGGSLDPGTGALVYRKQSIPCQGRQLRRRPTRTTQP